MSNYVNLIDYLKTVSELESSKYTQEQVLAKAKSEIKYRKLMEWNPKEPVHQGKSLQKPTPPEKQVGESAIKEENIGTHNTIWAIVLAIGLIATFGCLSNPEKSGSDWTLIFLLIVPFLVLMPAGFIALGRSEKKYRVELRDQYEIDLAKYNEQMEEAERQYQEEYSEYLQNKKEADEYNEKQRAESQQRFDEAQAEIESLKDQLQETKKVLNRIYSMGVIFPKYRNLVAVSMMYEYLSAGRVMGLTGPNGAYNLYETELRQNLIINKLDNISSQLEDIRNNQYILYQAVTDANTHLMRIVYQLEKVNEGLDTVANNTALAAYHAEIAAKNTEALKYIDLVS